MSDFLTDHGVVVALICAAFAVLYGIVVTQRLLAKPAGDARMVEISGAIQEGASAYLKRQYLIITAVAVPLVVLLLILQNWQTALGFVIGGVLSGAAGFIGMNLSVRANSRVAEAAKGVRFYDQARNVEFFGTPDKGEAKDLMDMGNKIWGGFQKMKMEIGYNDLIDLTFVNPK